MGFVFSQLKLGMRNVKPESAWSTASTELISGRKLVISTKGRLNFEYKSTKCIIYDLLTCVKVMSYCTCTCSAFKAFKWSEPLKGLSRIPLSNGIYLSLDQKK